MMFKRVFCIVAVVLTIFSLCACGTSESGSSSNVEMTPEQQVSEVVKNRAMFNYMGSTIGDNELKSSSATITNVKEISDTEYLVSGRITMIDVYGTNWNNTFDCSVTKNINDEWVAGSFEYTNDNWSKSS